MQIIYLKDNNFNDLIQDKVLVDFFATWCGPCKMIGMELEKVNSELKVIKVDTDKYEDIAKQYGIMSIPTIILFEKGKEVKRNIGFIPKDKIEKFLK